MYKYYFLFLMNILTFISTISEATTVKRAAFDFGSGKIKMQISDVDTEKNKITQFHLAHGFEVRLNDDLERNGNGSLSSEIQSQAVESVKKLKEIALQYGVEEFSGVATAVYRKAKNGLQLIQKYNELFGIPVQIISQEEEGSLGFLAATHEMNLEANKAIVWDIGGGSSQISYLANGKLEVYGIPFGRNTAQKIIISQIQHKDVSTVSSPNPVSNEEAIQATAYLLALMSPLPESLKLKLLDPETQLKGIGAHPEEFRGKSYTRNQICESLQFRLNKTDEDLNHLPKPFYAVSDLIFIYSVLSTLDRHEVNYFPTQAGLTTAILLNPQFWNTLE